ncbi:MAG: hypothetical protein JXM68_04315, partial [Sedimentisphaerales bacterium]|nr:hypothetical protein [Sedimentisphaerales bacterium]
GTEQTITWKSGRSGGNVTIQYSPDGGTTWKTVVASTPDDDGSYTWIVPNDVSGNVKIRVIWPVLSFGGTAASKVSSAVDYQSSNKILFLDVTSDFLINEYVTIASAMFGNFSAVSAKDTLELDYYGQGGINALDDKYIAIMAPSDVAFVGSVGDGWSYNESALKVLE